MRQCVRECMRGVCLLVWRDAAMRLGLVLVLGSEVKRILLMCDIYIYVSVLGVVAVCGVVLTLK